ncbi:Trypsin-like peptidase domain-containing protein [Nannocystis exedens]|uniref:Trypsin-like peptidase domain-containing protein n=1 Tax=Nannocystis exedens TaxID=54 RepID=A0A1I2HUQ3_9BACT|nr:serine protease [Nannocystis exedens]PCC69411.1 protease [Nannocystis exedens]SFF32131.1 Trypsin-like peptidase domain-containing protein [Nannocystis exedens]
MAEERFVGARFSLEKLMQDYRGKPLPELEAERFKDALVAGRLDHRMDPNVHPIDPENLSIPTFNGSFAAPPSGKWAAVLAGAQSRIEPAIAGVGRFELAGPPHIENLGTAWLVRPDVIATASHLGHYFRELQTLGKSELFVDFVAEKGSTRSHEFKVTQLLGVSETLHVAFLKIDVTRRAAVPPAGLVKFAGEPRKDQAVCLIGYPAERTAFYPEDWAAKIFGEIFDVKRVAPGRLHKVTADELWHDCSTLGGSSGSLLVDAGTGEAVGLHYGGVCSGDGPLCQYNLAAPAPAIRAFMDSLHI